MLHSRVRPQNLFWGHLIMPCYICGCLSPSHLLLPPEKFISWFSRPKPEQVFQYSISLLVSISPEVSTRTGNGLNGVETVSCPVLHYGCCVFMIIIFLAWIIRPIQPQASKLVEFAENKRQTGGSEEICWRPCLQEENWWWATGKKDEREGRRPPCQSLQHHHPNLTFRNVSILIPSVNHQSDWCLHDCAVFYTVQSLALWPIAPCWHNFDIGSMEWHRQSTARVNDISTPSHENVLQLNTILV